MSDNPQVFRGLAFSIFAAVGTGFVVWLLRGAAMVSDPLGLVAFLFYGILFATVLALAVGIPIHLSQRLTTALQVAYREKGCDQAD